MTDRERHALGYLFDQQNSTPPMISVPAFLARKSPVVGILCMLLCMVMLAIPALTRAQAPEAAAPDSTTDTGVLGQTQRVEADVGEGTQLAGINLFYRFQGKDYAKVPMWPTNRPGIYVAEVPTRDVEAPRMEYYILAERKNGARLLRGNENAPLQRKLVSASPVSAEPDPAAPVDNAATAAAPPEPSTSSKRKYWYYALGILAVGAIAVAASSGGDGSSDEDSGCVGDECNLPLVLPPSSQ